MTKSLYIGPFVSMILIATLTISCAEESDLHIDQSLEPFFVNFKAEAAKRGITVDFESFGVEGFIADISQENVVGQCSHTEESPNAVSIDPTFWQIASESRKEFVIFHELGHCYLQRSHLDTTDEFGNCISMMSSSADACKVNYERNRDQYLDELFSN